MKTQTKGFAKFLKNVALTSIMALTIVSCGKKNSSGNTPQAYGSYGAYAGIGVQSQHYANVGSVIADIERMNPCPQYNSYPNNQPVANHRVTSVVQVQQSGGLYLGKPVVGITVEGDIAVMYSNGGQATIEVRACNRPDLVGAQVQGNLMNLAQPIQEQYCPVDGLVADIAINAQYGQYILKFFPITVNGQIASQICR